MKIGDRVYVHGYVDEIRKDTVIIRNDGGYFGTVKSEIVEAQKAEDIVSVIRCKDCKYWEYYDEGDFGITYGECRSPQWFHTTINGLETTADDYCSWAERKEEK